MTLLRYRDISKYDSKEREKKLSELRSELIKSNVTANKQNAKTKEIKKAIARLLTQGKLSVFEAQKTQPGFSDSAKKLRRLKTNK